MHLLGMECNNRLTLSEDYSDYIFLLRPIFLSQLHKAKSILNKRI